MKKIRFKHCPDSHWPKGTMADVPMDDIVRGVVSPQNISYINNSLTLTADGLRQLASAVIDGRISGDQEAARHLLSELKDQFPKA